MQLTSYDSLQKILAPPGRTFQNIMSTSSLLLKMKSLVFACFLTCLTRSAFAAVILDGPSNLTVRPGEWGNFSCTVACTHAIDWYVEGYAHDITAVCTETRDGMMVCRQRVTDVRNCNPNDGYTEMLYIMAGEAVQNQRIALQCGATARSISLSSNDCPPYLAYSRYAFLNVRAVNTPTPTPSPTLCPSPTPERTTVTETLLLSVTVTVTATPTVTPEPFQTSSAHQRIGFGITAELLTHLVTLLAGIIFI